MRTHTHTHTHIHNEGTNGEEGVASEWMTWNKNTTKKRKIHTVCIVVTIHTSSFHSFMHACESEKNQGWLERIPKPWKLDLVDLGVTVAPLTPKLTSCDMYYTATVHINHSAKVQNNKRSIPTGAAPATREGVILPGVVSCVSVCHVYIKTLNKVESVSQSTKGWQVYLCVCVSVCVCKLGDWISGVWWHQPIALIQCHSYIYP